MAVVEFSLDSGGAMLVEVADDAPAGEPTVRGWRDDPGEQLPRRAQESFETAVTRVRPAAEALLASLTGLDHSPDEVAVEFAVQLSAKAGAVITTLGSSANFKIGLTWYNTSRPPT